jgi:hypothetical protein
VTLKSIGLYIGLLEFKDRLYFRVYNNFIKFKYKAWLASENKSIYYIKGLY